MGMEPCAEPDCHYRTGVFLSQDIVYTLFEAPLSPYRTHGVSFPVLHKKGSCGPDSSSQALKRQENKFFRRSKNRKSQCGFRIASPGDGKDGALWSDRATPIYKYFRLGYNLNHAGYKNP